MFPTSERQEYYFTLNGTEYWATHEDGQYTVHTQNGEWWQEMDDTDADYWVGVVYAYKMTDDDTLNVYTSQDYYYLACACRRLNQVPSFAALEELIGYSPEFNGSVYTNWAERVDNWLRHEQSMRHWPSPDSEGAD